MSTLRTTNITHESNSGTNNLILDDTGKVTVAEKKLHCPGTIIQVASTTKSDSNAEVDCADGAWLTVSGLTVSMAATAASNKILITGFLSVSMSSDERLFYRLTAGGSAIGVGDAAGNRARASGGILGNTYMPQSIPINYLYAPGNTNSITYGVDMSQGAGGTTGIAVNVQRTSDSDAYDRCRLTSVLTLMEVVA